MGAIKGEMLMTALQQTEKSPCLLININYILLTIAERAFSEPHVKHFGEMTNPEN